MTSLLSVPLHRDSWSLSKTSSIRSRPWIRSRWKRSLMHLLRWWTGMRTLCTCTSVTRLSSMISCMMRYCTLGTASRTSSMRCSQSKSSSSLRLPQSSRDSCPTAKSRSTGPTQHSSVSHGQTSISWSSPRSCLTIMARLSPSSIMQKPLYLR